MVGTIAARVLECSELRRPIVQLNALQQTLLRFERHLAKHTHRVFAHQVITRMHQSVGQFAGRGEQQQAAGIEVEATDRDPARTGQARKRW